MPTYDEEQKYFKGEISLDDFPLHIPPTYGTDFIVLRRKNKIKQGISRWLTRKSGLMIRERDNDLRDIVNDYKSKFSYRLSNEVPSWAVPISLIDSLMDRLVNHLKKVSTNIREIYYEDFEDMKPYEVLEFMGITDYEIYLDKNFTIPFIKTCTR